MTAVVVNRNKFLTSRSHCIENRIFWCIRHKKSLQKAIRVFDGCWCCVQTHERCTFRTPKDAIWLSGSVTKYASLWTTNSLIPCYLYQSVRSIFYFKVCCVVCVCVCTEHNGQKKWIVKKRRFVNHSDVNALYVYFTLNVSTSLAELLVRIVHYLNKYSNYRSCEATTKG